MEAPATHLSYRPYMKPKDLSFEGYVNDILALSKYLIRRFNQEKIYLVGESFGSYISTLALLQEPTLFKAYIGYGQIVDDPKALDIQYRLLQEKIKSIRGIDRFSRFKKLQKPLNGSFESPEDEQRFFRYFYQVMEADMPSFEEREKEPLLESDEYTALDKKGYLKGAALSRRASKKWPPVSLLKENIDLDIPYYIFSGRKDYITPQEIAPLLLERVKSPKKEIVWFEEAGHIVAFEKPSQFMRALRKRFR